MPTASPPPRCSSSFILRSYAWWLAIGLTSSGPSHLAGGFFRSRSLDLFAEETPSEALSCRLSPSEALRLDGAMYSPTGCRSITHRVSITRWVTNLV